MNAALKRMICRLLAVALVVFPFHSVQAGMIGTDQVISSASSQVDRTVVLDFLNRAQTTNEFQALGLDPQAARDRVAAMTDAEVSMMAGKINALPAGADGGAVLLVILIVLGIWWFAFRR